MVGWLGCGGHKRDNVNPLMELYYSREKKSSLLCFRGMMNTVDVKVFMASVLSEAEDGHTATEGRGRGASPSGRLHISPVAEIR